MRRLLVLCAVAVTVCAALALFARAQSGPAAALSVGAGGFQVQFPDPPGCPIGSGVFVFCSLIPGTSSAPLLVTVEIGTAVTNPAVTLVAAPGLSANFAAGDFAISNNTCTGSLAAGSKCTFDVTFSPTTTGLRAAEITFNSENLLIVEGTGATLIMSAPTPPVCAPAIISDNAFMYCQQPVGATSGTQTFTLTSTNAITGLSIAPVAVPGLESEFNALQPDFTIESTTCTGTLGANASCTVSVAFTPKTAGLRTAALTATDSEGDSAAVLTLAGQSTTGLAVTIASLPVEDCARTDFVYCNEPTAGSTGSRAYTLTNNSGTQVTGVKITPAVPTVPPPQPPPPPTNFTVESTSCTTTLAVNASCVINVAFTPTTTGLLQGEILVTDDQGDVAGFNLAGTGDDFNMQIVNGQPTEVTVHQGGTATFMAQLNAIGVFGQNGEQVSLACPPNLPAFATCAFMPCPMKPTVGGTTSFSIVIVTSSTTVQAPEVPNPCNSPSAAFAPGPRGAPPMMRAIGERLERVPPFPALLAILAAATIGLGGIRALPRSKRALAGVALAIAMAGGGLMLGCGGGGGNATKAFPTPIAVTTMNVVANATDSNGNPLNASRGLQITLDVIK